MDTIITIGRQHGSGGAEIGRLAARQLGIPCYDKEKLKEYAVERGLGRALLDSYGEKHASSLLFTLATGAYSFGYYDAAQRSSISQKTYLAAFETIREIARKGPCVLVGRCADYVLRDRPDCLHTFVHAPLADRAARIADREGLDMERAEERAREQDRLRRSYYNYYTAKNWGEMDSYHLSLDSGLLGLEETAALLCRIVGMRERGDPCRPQVHMVRGARATGL